MEILDDLVREVQVLRTQNKQLKAKVLMMDDEFKKMWTKMKEENQAARESIASLTKEAEALRTMARKSKTLEKEAREKLSLMSTIAQIRDQPANVGFDRIITDGRPKR
eukprot:TRINITY_DN776688_c0_g1_i1.p1 TRINITY_DN776688_c0_g1~~TRINITY_DN776688_c0_g1_i1.p1  ORF type:complete len:108 (+),score=22.41 TRINITY_DN776688_c0_g1_i1:129-452(+)